MKKFEEHEKQYVPMFAFAGPGVSTFKEKILGTFNWPQCEKWNSRIEFTNSQEAANSATTTPMICHARGQ